MYTPDIHDDLLIPNGGSYVCYGHSCTGKGVLSIVSLMYR